MKTRTFFQSSIALATVSALALLAGNTLAQDSSATATVTAPAATSRQAAPQLSYGVSQIVDLTRAKVSDDVVVKYIQNSGNSYGLDAAQIIYLRQQGISDTVLNAMLNQRQMNAPANVQSSTQTYSDTGGTATTATAQPSVSYIQTAPASTVYVIPDTQTYRYNDWYYSSYPYYCYPYYGGYYGYGYPAVSLSVGFGGYYGGYYGGYHGGYHSSGGYHGGGGYHWHR